jgi:hypothetical protein
MTARSEDVIKAPPGEGMRWALLCLVYLGAVAVAVVFSPAAGLWHPQQAHSLIAALP